MTVWTGILLAAGTATAREAMWRTLAWAGVLLAAVLVMAVVIGLSRSKGKNDAELADDQENPAGFSLDDLRRLHRAGKLTDEEFARAKARLLAGMGAGEEAEEPEEPPAAPGV